MSHPEMKARVQRLISGSFVAEDITRIFLFARDRCDGRETVQEMGDFVAHREERQKGMLTRTAKDFVCLVRLQIWLKNSGGIDETSIPRQFCSALWATLRNLHPKALSKDLQLNRNKADKLLKSISDQMIGNDDGTFSLSPNLTGEETDLVRYLCNRPFHWGTFTGDKLYADIVAVLKRQDLLTASQEKAFSKHSAAVKLFAVTCMHRCKINFDDVEQVWLNTELRGPNVSVSCNFVARHDGSGGGVVVSFPSYYTQLSVERSCTQRLLSKRNENLYNQSIELTSDALLDAIEA